MSDLEQIRRTLVHAVVSAGSIAVEDSGRMGGGPVELALGSCHCRWNVWQG